MRSFIDWSGWFERMLENEDIHGSQRPNLLAVMGWIISASDSEGGAWALDENYGETHGREVGLTPKDFDDAIQMLRRLGFIAIGPDHDNATECRVVFEEPRA